jgi:O-acetyl-ADP-ribose deacetylase (regulator of RNase III)
MPLGSAVLTGAGRLPFKGIIHVAGINMLWMASERSIRDRVSAAIEIVNREGFKSVAFPIIGSGSGSFDEGTALTLITSELEQRQTAAEVIVVRYASPGRVG